MRDQAAVVVAELDRWLARAEADEDDRPNRRLAGGLPQGLAGALAADALAGGRLKDSDWDYLAAHYLGCAAMAHAGGGASVVPWGGDVRGLEKALRFPDPWRFDSPVGFGPARLGEVRLGFEKLAKYQLSGAK